MRPLHELKVLILHPFFNFYGGAEYLTSVVARDIFPQAKIYTFSYKDSVIKEMGIDPNRITTPMGNGILSSLYRQMTPLYPAMIDTLSVDSYDLVLSFSYGYVHGVVTGQRQPHFAYIQTPMRLLWLNESEFYWYNNAPIVKDIYRSILSWQRVWDRQAATRPDYLVANSGEVSKRINAFWKRDAAVIHPPVDTAFYNPKKPVVKEEYFITHSRLVRYKKIDILIEACRQQKKKLIVVGDGPDYPRLKAAAKGSKDIQFTGYVIHEEKRELLQKAQGFLFAAHEDFGIAPVEALASGTPVLAYGAGGVIETISRDTGMFYHEQTIDSVIETLPQFQKFSEKVNPNDLYGQASLFSKENFIQNYTSFISEKTDEFFAKGPPLIV